MSKNQSEYNDNGEIKKKNSREIDKLCPRGRRHGTYTHKFVPTKTDVLATQPHFGIFSIFG